MLQTAKRRNGSEAKKILQESAIYCKTANCSSSDHKIKITAFKSSNLCRNMDSGSFSVRYPHCRDLLMAKAPTLSL